MALLGMGANVQCNGYFMGYCSTRDLLFGAEGTAWTSSNGKSELKNDCYHNGSFPVPLPGHLLGYNKELLKQTILKHEAIFRDQIHELHRLYQKQREIMDEVRRNQLYKDNLRIEISWSNSSVSHVSSKNAQKICCLPKLPWATGESSTLIAQSIQFPLGSVQEKSRQVSPAPALTPVEGSSKDSKLSNSNYRKIGKQILDLQLPTDEYIDSEEGESLEDERFSKVAGLSADTLNGISQVEHNSDGKPYGADSNHFSDLNEPFKLEDEAAVKSDDLVSDTHLSNTHFHEKSRRTILGPHNLHHDVIQYPKKQQDIQACSNDPPSKQEKKHEQLSSTDSAEQSCGVLDSSADVIDTEKLSVSSESLNKLEQVNNLPCSHSLDQINQGPSSAGTQGHPTSNGLFLGPSSASRMCAQLVSEADMIKLNSRISPVETLKTSVSDLGQSPFEVHALPCFSTCTMLGQSSKSMMGMPGITGNEFYQCKSIISVPNLESQNFLLSSFCSGPRTSDPSSISTCDLNSSDKLNSPASHGLRKQVTVSEYVGTPKDINLNVMPAVYSDTTAFQSISIKDEENKFQDSRRGLPWLKEKPVPERQLSEESKISTPMESVLLKPYNLGCVRGFELKEIEESDLCREKTLAFHINGKPHTSSDLRSSHASPSKGCQNQSKNQKIEEIGRVCVFDVNLPCNLPDLGEQIPDDEHYMKNELEKKHKCLAGIIDLNSCMNEDESMPIDIDFQAPVSPENKESSPPRGESDEKWLEVPYRLTGQEEQVRIAAEALVSISAFVAQNDLQLTTCSPSVSFVTSPLHWFAGIVSSIMDRSENEVKVDCSGKTDDLDEFLPAGIDYFEAMTLKLTETKTLDCCCKISGQNEEDGGSTTPTQPRKGWTKRGRRQKDFQREILPSLASLSRYEVTEDLQTIGGLIEAASTHLETGSLRSAGRNVLARGRKRPHTSASNVKDALKKLTNNTELDIEKRGLLSWEKICRKRRGRRYPVSKPQFILRQVYN